MTDQSSTQSQPSMEDILASIRRIIDDEDVAAPAASAAAKPAPAQPESQGSFAVDDDAAALARAEYDAAMAADTDTSRAVDPASESIFPQRDGALWRRVAGHPLSEGETDPLPEDEALELTDAVDDAGGFDELELNELLDSTGGSDPEADARLLDQVADSSPDDNTASTLGIGAMTAAGVGAAGVAASGTMDRITERMAGSQGDARGDDGDVLDLTRSLDDDGSIAELDSAARTPQPPEVDDMPPPIFERVDVPPSAEAPRRDADEEISLDRSFEAVEVKELSEDYAGALAGHSEDGDARERALDERFYAATDLDEDPPEITGDYAASLGGDAQRSRPEGAPTEDEMETVGGLVRDALRGRLPVPQGDGEENALVTGNAEDSAARSLATLARYDAHAPRRIYGGIKITEDDDSPTIEGMVQDTLRPMLRDWLNDNLPTLVESMVKQEVERISARSRRYVKDDE